MNRSKFTPTLFLLGLGAGLAGCGSLDTGDNPSQPVNFQHTGGTAFDPSSTGIQYSPANTSLADRSVDYLLALRTASLKLRGNLPTLAEQQQLKQIVDSGDAQAAQTQYETMIHGMIYSSPLTFNRQMFHYWRNTLRMGGQMPLTAPFMNSSTTTKQVSIDTGPAYAAMLIAEDQDLRKLFTGQVDTCPTFDQTSTNPATQFTKANCFVANGAATAMPGNNVPAASQAGILTNPGFQAQYYSNFAFRRARVVQELFACSRYPAELAKTPTQVGAYLYSSPWPINSVTNASQGFQAQFNHTIRPRRLRDNQVTAATNNEYVDFKADCQNCHTTLNARAPLFGVFDQVGYRDMNNLLMVTSTATNSPYAQIQEYQYKCNPTAADGGQNPVCKGVLAWKFEGKRFDFGGTTVPDFPGFGQEMADDPQVAKCFMIRAWNHAYSRDDVVDSLALVPDSVIGELTDHFVKNNYNMKAALYKLYTDANFIRF